MHVAYVALSLFVGWAGASTPTHFGRVEWEFEASDRFEGFNPYKIRDSAYLNPGTTGANYPPCLRESIEPFVRRAGLVELRRHLAADGANPGDGAAFDYACFVKSSRAPRATHDGDGGIITFGLRCSAVMIGSDRRFGGISLDRVRARSASDDWVDVPPGGVVIRPGEPFGTLILSGVSGARRWVRFDATGRTHDVDLDEADNRRACELILRPS